MKGLGWACAGFLGGSWGGILGPIGWLWAFLGWVRRCWGGLGESWGIQRRSWASPGPVLGRSSEGLGPSWRRPRERLGVVLGHFGISWRHFGASWRYVGAFFTWIAFCDRLFLDFMKIFWYVEHMKNASGTTKIVVSRLHGPFT